MYCGYVVEVKDLRVHPNADRLQIARVFGEDVCVGSDVQFGDTLLYFPCDGQLTLEYCDANDLCRKHEDGTPGKGYLEREKRHVTAIKLRGSRSNGILMPLDSLAFTGVKLSDLKVGDEITTVNGHLICKKYIPRTNPKRSAPADPKARKHKIKNIEDLPYFAEHIDTPQLRFVQDMFQPGDVICLTEKVHGTSSRNANTLCVSHKQSLFDKIFHRAGKEVRKYKEVVGTRRTTVRDAVGGFYGSHQFRMDWGDKLKGKLRPGEEVFGEIAGFTDTGTPIMGIADNRKTKDKQFIKMYGDNTVFSYGCAPDGDRKSRYFIYRMNYTTPEGDVIEYPWDMVKLRAEQLGFETVPELDRFIYTTQEDFMIRIARWMDIPSTIDPSHIIEGVVVRALNAPGFRVAKNKSFNFQVIEGIIKETSQAPDMEEAEEAQV